MADDSQLGLIVVSILAGYILIIGLTTYAVVSSRSSNWLKASAAVVFLIYAVGVPLTLTAKELTGAGLWESLVSVFPV